MRPFFFIVTILEREDDEDRSDVMGPMMKIELPLMASTAQSSHQAAELLSTTTPSNLKVTMVVS